MNSGDTISTFRATIQKVQTLTAGGFRVTYDGLSEDIAQAAFQMPFADTPGVLVEVTVKIIQIPGDTEEPIIFKK
jgi:hypothetical protein